MPLSAPKVAANLIKVCLRATQFTSAGLAEVALQRGLQYSSRHSFCRVNLRDCDEVVQIRRLKRRHKEEQERRLKKAQKPVAVCDGALNTKGLPRRDYCPGCCRLLYRSRSRGRTSVPLDSSADAPSRILRSKAAVSVPVPAPSGSPRDVASR